MLLPIGDENVRGGKPPILSYSFIAINILIFIWQTRFDGMMVCELGAIPADIRDGQNMYALLSSMFMHGSWMHLIGNMVFLWIFADNIEATVGSGKFFLFYIIGGIAAVLAHMYLGVNFDQINCCSICSNAIPCNGISDACSYFTPLVGASGAISAVLGAYLVMFPTSKVKLLFIVFPFRLPAFLFLGFWIVQQYLRGMESLTNDGSNVAWWAHIGGFAFGLIIGIIFRNSIPRDNSRNQYKTYI
ncbi:MAG: rhomboid family intramembrane serine protease [Saprospiraceae bacterium]|nr:rhomboid family intramembrane serine protease [Saprospiraceae bacterium]